MRLYTKAKYNWCLQEIYLHIKVQNEWKEKDEIKINKEEDIQKKSGVVYINIRQSGWGQGILLQINREISIW